MGIRTSAKKFAKVQMHGNAFTFMRLVVALRKLWAPQSYEIIDKVVQMQIIA